MIAFHVPAKVTLMIHSDIDKQKFQIICIIFENALRVSNLGILEKYCNN